MTLLSEEITTFPVWTLSEVEEALLERMRKMLSESECSQSEPEEERPCWWIVSALDRLDGKDAREVYYAKLWGFHSFPAPLLTKQRSSF